MRPINNAVDELFQPRELAEDEYLNEADGLMYCSKCHTPRQHRIELKERVFLPTVRCRCQQEIYDKEEAERKHQEFLIQVSRLRTNGLDELKHPKDLARARIYDRVLERCVPLKINNQNIRELNAAANMQEARKILNSGT